MPETGEGTLAQKTSRLEPEGLFSMALAMTGRDRRCGVPPERRRGLLPGSRQQVGNRTL